MIIFWLVDFLLRIISYTTLYWACSIVCNFSKTSSKLGLESSIFGLSTDLEMEKEVVGKILELLTIESILLTGGRDVVAEMLLLAPPR